MSTESQRLFTIFDRVGETYDDGQTRARPGRTMLVEQAGYLALIRKVGLSTAAVYTVLNMLAEPSPDGTLQTVITRDQLAALLSEKEGGGTHSGYRKDALRVHLTALEAAGYITAITPSRSNEYSRSRYVIHGHLVAIEGGQSGETTAVVGTAQAAASPGGGISDPSVSPGVGILDPCGVAAARAGDGASEIPAPGGAGVGEPVPLPTPPPNAVLAGQRGGGIPVGGQTARMVIGDGETSSTTHQGDPRWPAIVERARALGFTGSPAVFYEHSPEFVSAWVEAIEGDPEVNQPGAYLRSVLRYRSPAPSADTDAHPTSAPVPATQAVVRPGSGTPRGRVDLHDPRLLMPPWDGGVTLSFVQIRAVVDDLPHDEADGLYDLIRARKEQKLAALGRPPERHEEREAYETIATQVLVELGYAGPQQPTQPLRVVQAPAAEVADVSTVHARFVASDPYADVPPWEDEPPGEEHFPPDDARWG